MARTRAIDFEAKQRAILVSAAAVFAGEGMDKASMSRIALRSNVSKALLYHYYPSKDALIFGIIRAHLSELDAALEAADDAAAAPESRLRSLIRAVLDNHRDADDQHKVQLNGTSALNDEQKDAIRAIELRIVTRFSNVLRDLNPDLDDRARPLLMPVTLSLFGMLNWVSMWFRRDGPITREDYADVATTLILDGIKAVR
jgi:AcrR family transcriptional regulator